MRGVGVGREDTGSVVGGFERSLPGAHAGAGDVDRLVEQRAALHRPGPAQGADQPARRIHALGQLPLRNAHAGAVHGGDAVEPERPPVGAVVVERDQIPAATRGHQVVRFDETLAYAAAGLGVCETHLLVRAACRRQSRQRFGIHLDPATGREHVGPRQVRHPTPQSAGQHLFEFRQGPQRGVLDAGDRRPRAGAQPDGDRDGFLVVEHQRRQRRARDQAISADIALGGVHRIPEFAQPFDIPPDGARTGPQPLGQFDAGPFPRGLQQRQQV